jgi:GNAT superfamily N-acetyltransferase
LKISSSRYLELPAGRRQQLIDAANAEFAQFDLVRDTQWSPPDWTFLALEGEELAAFYNLVERTVRIDGVPVRAVGLNNLVTLPAHRGRGLGSRLLRETEGQWFDSLAAEAGLLLCADALLPFYSRLGWRKMDARVTYTQPGGPRVWAANCMLLDPRRKVSATRDVDLCGFPW